MSEAWVQFLLVAVPVLSLVGSWMALKAVGDRKARRHGAKINGDLNGQ